MEELAVQVMTAIRERDLLASTSEQKAGRALQEMTSTEGSTLREAVEWRNARINVRDATRLLKLAAEAAIQLIRESTPRET